jgi:hypothetical protein
MFKTLARHFQGAVIAGLAVAALVGLGAVGSAAAFGFDGPHFGDGPSDVTLNGAWAPFDRCPVDNPTMLSADGATNLALCVAVSGPSGSITIGKVTAPIGGSDTQNGLILNNTEGTQTLVPPPGGALVGSPLALPGGLQALVCPSSARALREVCRGRPDRFLNTVTTTLASAGAPSNFNLFAGLELGAPILTLPVKLELDNPLLGEDCSIGTNSEPIVLRPANVTPPTPSFSAFDANGTPDPSGPMLLITLTGATQGDNQLAIPGAHDCGFAGLLDHAIDHNVGLPSPAGNNNVVLNEVTSSLTGLNSPEAAAPNDGHVLSSNWHSAVLHGHDHEHH